MYFSAKIAIDPSQKTDIKRAKPTRAFGKVLKVLTLGLSSKKEEQETFTMVSILQQINTALRALKINNIVHLFDDDTDFYLDEEGKQNDSKIAMHNFELELDTEAFQGCPAPTRVSMVLEHEDEVMKYLLRFSVARKHAIGAYPVQLGVNGMVREFVKNEGESDAEFKERHQGNFATAEAHEKYRHRLRDHFDGFLDRIEHELQKVIQSDDLQRDSRVKVIRPPERLKDVPQGRFHRERDCPDLLQYGYWGYDPFILSAFLWSDLAYANNIHCQDLTLVDSGCQPIMTIGDEGFDAGAFDALNLDKPFEAPLLNDATYYNSSEYAQEMAAVGMQLETGDGSFGGDTSFEFGADAGASGGDTTTTSSCGGSSCSSASSCGSSCSSCGGCGSS